MLQLAIETLLKHVDDLLNSNELELRHPTMQFVSVIVRSQYDEISPNVREKLFSYLVDNHRADDQSLRLLYR